MESNIPSLDVCQEVGVLARLESMSLIYPLVLRYSQFKYHHRIGFVIDHDEVWFLRCHCDVWRDCASACHSLVVRQIYVDFQLWLSLNTRADKA